MGHSALQRPVRPVSARSREWGWQADAPWPRSTDSSLGPRHLRDQRHRGLDQAVPPARPRLPPAARDAQRPAAKQWDAHGGSEVKTVGDSFVVAFPQPRRALAAAVAAQQRLTSHPWPEGAAIKVRIGVHTGMAFPHEGDYIALALHQTARVVGARKRRVRARLGGRRRRGQRRRGRTLGRHRDGGHVPPPRLRPAGDSVGCRAAR